MPVSPPRLTAPVRLTVPVRLTDSVRLAALGAAAIGLGGWLPSASAGEAHWAETYQAETYQAETYQAGTQQAGTQQAETQRAESQADVGPAPLRVADARVRDIRPAARRPVVQPRRVDVLPAPGSSRPSPQPRSVSPVYPPAGGFRPAPQPGRQQVETLPSPGARPATPAAMERSYSMRPSLAPTLTLLGNELAAVADHVAPSVVHIYSVRASGSAETGSGVLMPDTRTGGVVVVTNRHVVAGASLKNISVKLHDGRELRPVEKAEDPQTDLAVLRLRDRTLQPSSWADSDQLRIGHFVMAAGSPFGLRQSVTLGIVSATGRRALALDENIDVINQDFIQTDAAINPGNSGGPLFDMTGRVVGINTAIASKSGGNDGIGFSIPSSLARYVTDQLLMHGLVRRGFLGVDLDKDFTADEARQLRLQRATGARVVHVKPNTPAAHATVRVDDVIVEFNGHAIEDNRHLVHLVSLTPPEQAVQLTVLRDGRELPLQVRLAERRTQRADAEEELPAASPRLGAVPQVELSL